MTSQPITMRRSTALTAALALAVGACGGSAGSGDVDIPPQEPALVSAGAGLYQASCAGCHGENLEGTDDGPSMLSAVYEPNHHGDGAFLLAVQRGVLSHHWRFGDMPAIEGLTPDDVFAIVAFVREQQRTQGFEPYSR